MGVVSGVNVFVPDPRGSGVATDRGSELFDLLLQVLFHQCDHPSGASSFVVILGSGFPARRGGPKPVAFWGIHEPC